MKYSISNNGGVRFIGSNLVIYLIRNYQACRIIILDKMTYTVTRTIENIFQASLA